MLLIFQRGVVFRLSGISQAWLIFSYLKDKGYPPNSSLKPGALGPMMGWVGSSIPSALGQQFFIFPLFSCLSGGISPRRSIVGYSRIAVGLCFHAIIYYYVASLRSCCSNAVAETTLLFYFLIILGRLFLDADWWKHLISSSQSVSALCGNEIVWHFDMSVKHFSDDANSRDFDLGANWFRYNKQTPPFHPERKIRGFNQC